MKPWNARQLAVTVAAAILGWLILGGICLMVGSTGTVGFPSTRAGFTFRMEMVLLASLVGAALSCAGVVFQAILRNPLAEPYLLGVSSGASLASYLWQRPWVTTVLTIAGARLAIGQQAAAFAGALAAIAIVFLLSTRRGRLEPITLLLVGVIVNAVNGSVFMLCNTLLKDPGASTGITGLLAGQLQTNLSLSQEIAAAFCTLIGIVVLMYLSGQLNVAMLSEAEATSLGVRIHRLRWIALVVASLVTASAVAVSGPIGFVGLVCPHLCRMIVGNDQRRLLPIATAAGAGLLACADALSRWLSAQGRANTTLPVGVLTGLLGGPFFLLLLYQNRRKGASS